MLDTASCMLPSEDFKGEDKALNAMTASKEKAKDLSYYYGQTEPKALPENTIVRQDDPLFRADGTGPKALEKASGLSSTPDESVRWMDKYSFIDEGEKVKVYCEFPESLKAAKLEHEFEKFGVNFLAHMPNGTVYGLRIRDAEGWILDHERKGGFNAEIIPGDCKVRLSSSGERITLTLVKKDGKEKWYDLKKKPLSTDK